MNTWCRSGSLRHLRKFAFLLLAGNQLLYVDLAVRRETSLDEAQVTFESLKRIRVKMQ